MKLISKSLFALLLTLTPILHSCSQQTDITTTGVTRSNKGYSRSAPTDVTAILTLKGNGKTAQKVDISRGYTEYDRFTQVAYHITVGRQNTIFTSRVDQGNPVDDSITFSANGAQGKANTSITFQFDEIDESVGSFLRTYKMDDHKFIQGPFRQVVQQEMVRIMRGYNPVEAVAKQDEIAIKLKDALQKRFGKMLSILEVGFTDQFVFSDSVMKSISQASEAKSQEAAVQSQIELLNKQSALRSAEAAAFKQKSPDQLKYELDKDMVKQGMNIRQPSYFITQPTTQQVLKTPQETQPAEQKKE